MNDAEILQDLLYAANGDHPFDGLVQQLGRQCNGSATIFDTDHAVISSTGGAPRILIRQSLVEIEGSTHAVPIGRWFVSVGRVGVRSQNYFVALASQDRTHLEQIAATIFEALALMLGTVAAIEGTSLAQRAVSSVKTLQELEIGILVSQEPSYWRRLEQFGYTPFSNVQILICQAPETHEASEESVKNGLHLIRRYADENPVLVAESKMGTWQLLVPEGPLVTELTQLVHGTFIAALSEPFASLSMYPDMYRATKIALRHAGKNAKQSSSHMPNLVHAGSMSPIDWMIAASVDRLDVKVLRRFGDALRQDQELFESLMELLAVELDVRKAARSLNVHPNTLRYRMQKVERDLGGSLSDPWMIANLCLSFYDELRLRQAGPTEQRA